MLPERTAKSLCALPRPGIGQTPGLADDPFQFAASDPRRRMC